MPVQEQSNDNMSGMAEKKKTALEEQSFQDDNHNKEKLIPILDHLAEKQQYKIALLNDKIQTKTEKNEKHSIKIEKLTNRAESLGKTNQMLNAFLKQSNFPAINKAVEFLVQKNEAKIKKINEQRIPKRQAKIAKHNDKIKTYSNRIDTAKHKIAHYSNISNFIKSFAISDKSLRHESFLNSISGLNNDSQIKIAKKLEVCLEKISDLKNQYEKTDSSVTKFEIKEKLSSLNNKKTSFENRLNKLGKAQQAYVDIKSDILSVDRVMDNAEKCFDKHLAEEKPEKISNVMESVVTDNSDFVNDLLDKTQKQTKTAPSMEAVTKPKKSSVIDKLQAVKQIQKEKKPPVPSKSAQKKQVEL